MKTEIHIGKPVIGKDLIGREEEIKLIMQTVLEGQSIVLIAPRRFGKTSLLLEVLRRLKNKAYYTCYVDLFSTPTLALLSEQITENVLANKKLSRAFNTFRRNIEYLLKNIQFKHVVEDNEFLLSFAGEKRDEFQLIQDSIDFIDRFALQNNKNIIAGLDEFGELPKLNGEKLVKLFRSKLQLQKNSTYIFSGSCESVMSQIFISTKSPFYRFARIINLHYIDKRPFQDHIIKKLNENNLTISNEGTKHMLDFSCGHPYYTQLILRQIILSKIKKIEVKQVKDVIDSLLNMEINYLEKYWEELSRSRENIAVLLEIAKNEPSIYANLDIKKINVSRALKNLLNNGAINKLNDNYQFNDPLLHYWIRRKILRI